MKNAHHVRRFLTVLAVCAGRYAYAAAAVAAAVAKQSDRADPPSSLLRGDGGRRRRRRRHLQESGEEEDAPVPVVRDGELVGYANGNKEEAKEEGAIVERTTDPTDETTAHDGIVSAAVATDINEYYWDLQDVPNPSWEELKQNLTIGTNSNGPAYGSTILVNSNLVQGNSEYGHRRIQVPNRAIHSCTSSFINPSSFATQTRWYQEDNNTQIFRMFAGDDNVRNARRDAPRIESFSTTSWTRGDRWHEFSARYTFLKARYGAIFQLKHDDVYWSMQLVLSGNPANPGNFDLYYVKLRDPDAKKLLATNVVGQSYDIKVLDNGNRHKVYVNGVERLRQKMTPSDRVGGAGINQTDDENRARWGLYSPGKPMDRDVLIFVTGVYVGLATTTIAVEEGTDNKINDGYGDYNDDGTVSTNSATNVQDKDNDVTGAAGTTPIMSAIQAPDYYYNDTTTITTTERDDTFGGETTKTTTITTKDWDTIYNMKEPSNALIQEWYHPHDYDGDNDDSIDDYDNVEQGYI